MSLMLLGATVSLPASPFPPLALGFFGPGTGSLLVIAFATDVPDIHKTGVIGERFDSAKAGPGPGLWLEIAGGALVLLLVGAGFGIARGGRLP